MGDTYTGRPRGRQREADRNDVRLFQAAREVFAERGWDAPVSEIARRAGIGMGSLYRRYPSKELLAQRMRIAGMEQLVAQARTALAEEPDPWAALVRFFRDALTDQGTGGPLLPLVGGRLPATDEVQAAAERLRAALDDLVDGAHRAGVLRADFTSADIPLLLEHLAPRIPVTGERAASLHLRYLDLALVGLRTTGPCRPTDLHGPAPQWEELRDLWNAPDS
ncbi:TetR family transcriptional regulator [Streptomyces capoamus]|uniref:TetR family transcriptional regulator n=1 Tax=Streptomyces capoamus TaxID=68183 RepID=A0A919C2H7_9ACTN|nr:TetR/AcrR family transcriptional regulator [Streptomyces capoamus]GGW09405.1 TetR family transcriptional regulator [Streptomyces libani subsp. rufus]GHG44433.1 TetR family transcriptional regulator [Streptomyces capoamus]